MLQRIKLILRDRRTVSKAKRLFANCPEFIEALQMKRSGTRQLHTRDGLTINIRNNIWDARIVRETFLDQPYVSNLFKLPPEPLVVDVGGYIGDFSIWAAKYWGARVIVYEPIAENYQMLRKNIEPFGNQIIPVNMAVGVAQEVTLNVQTSDCGEIHVSEIWYEEAEKRVISCTDLAGILRAHHLERIDLLKVDTEGGEYALFPATPDDAYARINNIVFEYHGMDGFEKKLQRVLDRLKSAGYATKTRNEIVYAWK